MQDKPVRIGMVARERGSGLMDEINAVGYKWDPQYFRALVDATGMSLDTFAESCGVNKQSIFNYAKGASNPGIENLIKIADYLAVPLDYLVGRCDLETAEAILKDYSSCFMQMRRGPWEGYLQGRNHINRSLIAGNPARSIVESPWPYNLLDDIICPRSKNAVFDEDGEHWDSVLNDEQWEGLMYAIKNGLSERERKAINLYYERGLTLEEAGAEFGVTRERVRQMLAKAVRKLRHPVWRKLIEVGQEMAAEESEYQKKREELDRKNAVLDEDEAILSERLKRLSEARLLLQANGMWYQGISVKEGSGDAKPSAIDYQPITMTPIEAMDLSVRSYNCLKRRDLTTLGLVMDAARSGELSKVRNLGRKSLEEVLNKIKAITGEDYSALYGVNLYV